LSKCHAFALNSKPPSLPLSTALEDLYVVHVFRTRLVAFTLTLVKNSSHFIVEVTTSVTTIAASTIFKIARVKSRNLVVEEN